MWKNRLAATTVVTSDSPKRGCAARAVVPALVAAAVLVWSGEASAQQAKCLAGKTKCMSKKGAGLLRCHQLAETPGKPADVNDRDCRDKIVAKFDGGVDPTKGCFEKLENRVGNDCITFDDTTDAEMAVDSCVAAFVGGIDPDPITQSKCGAGKKKCVSKYLKALLRCHQLAQTPGKSSDPNFNSCIDKAKAKFNGGADPTKGCFAKLEAKVANDCMPPVGNSGTLQTAVEDCVDDFEFIVTNTTTTTSTSSTTSTSLPPGMVVGALAPPTKGRFNYNSMIGLPAVAGKPGVPGACDTQFPGSHPCSQQELLLASTSTLTGLVDHASTPVTSLWAIDATAPPLQQCQDDAFGGSGLNWEYGTAHTSSRGRKFALDNGTGVLTGPTLEQCALLGTTSWVACCQ